MKTLTLAALAVLLTVPAFAADAAPKKLSFSDWLQDMKNKFTASAVGEQRKAHGIVAAVRGLDQDKKNMADPDNPTLKGSSKDKKAKESLELDKRFTDALNFLIDKKPEAALANFEELKKNNPKYNTENVDRGIDEAKQAIAAKNNQPVPETAKKP